MVKPAPMHPGRDWGMFKITWLLEALNGGQTQQEAVYSKQEQKKLRSVIMPLSILYKLWLSYLQLMFDEGHI